MTLSQSEMARTVWQQARDLDSFHAHDLVKFGISKRTAQNYVRRWERAGMIRLVRVEKHRQYWRDSSRPVLAPEPVSADPTPEGNMWRSMRRLGQFTPIDIAAHSNAGGVELTVEKARAYCRQLLAADYLRVRQTAIPGKREALYQLIADTGPLPPRPKRVTGLFDPNTGSFYPNDKEVTA